MLEGKQNMQDKLPNKFQNITRGNKILNNRMWQEALAKGRF